MLLLLRNPFCMLLLLLALAWPACAATQANPGAAPILVEADRMVSRQQQETVLFTGHVEAKQGELVIHADEMTVHYEAQDAKQISGDTAQKIKKIMARGNVKIVKQGLVSTSDTMEFYALERKVILSGRAKAWQEKNMVTGDTIVLYLDEGKSVVESDGKTTERVKAFIYPGEGGNPLSPVEGQQTAE